MPIAEIRPIAFSDVAQQHAKLHDELRCAVDDVVGRNAFIGGRVVDEFAARWAECCGTKFAVPCANGTEALRLAIVASLGEGDGTREIITVSHTFIATVEAIVAARYQPVLVDVNPDTWVMNPAQVDRAARRNCAAVIPVHLYGKMVDLPELNRIARRRGIVVIEDAAQAHGAEFSGIRPGQSTAAAAFSFYPGKNLGAWGDAGAIVCNDAQLAQRLQRLVDHGRSEKYMHEILGGNARMSAIQAAVLNVKLSHLAAWNEHRRQIAKIYDAAFDRASIPRQQNEPECTHVYHQYVIRAHNRDEVRKALSECGVETGIHYPIPVHEQPAMANTPAAQTRLPITTALCRTILSLPIHSAVSPDDAQFIAEIVVRHAEMVETSVMPRSDAGKAQAPYTAPTERAHSIASISPSLNGIRG